MTLFSGLGVCVPASVQKSPLTTTPSLNRLAPHPNAGRTAPHFRGGEAIVPGSAQLSTSYVSAGGRR
eukprot:CAMPEP_0206270708 /NCGR_PEP_ID=MMETSP0047_2-20121206/33016_1 /ASSEMBLY_ACC=CAM_ASM_000192 /TAXON_ID=195065 /ORGANISM="Chroomonas mesostigmatica_cf, Strain CCMP1168" /LENGTH=66 /DNA_ID=CAMNT_0053699375 /DNA_START=188 /DNA_END=388 /DNA_ORIENTATION=-